ncbi:MAG: hypothetical protein LH614_13865 [Pyrinomonadaceae bacterium]|nr:hypothetical protein [Pyrinomonadaceae bacterium]
MSKKRLAKTLLVGFSLILALTFSASAQTKRQPSKKKTSKKTVPVNTKTVAENAAAAIKKNSRPENEIQPVTIEKPNETTGINSRPPVAAADKPVYFYEFAKSDFLISKIYIEHDENGKGKITFQKKDFAEPETDPLQLSPATLERLKTIWQALNFLDSTETYQTVRDYSNLGAMQFSMKKDGRTRTAAFNWTDNKDAKKLADEYRKIGQQSLWIFDISVARTNQPLEAPRLLDALDSMVRRGEVSDAAQMIPLLKELGNDERIPLIARNRATKLIEKIEKNK